MVVLVCISDYIAVRKIRHSLVNPQHACASSCLVCVCVCVCVCVSFCYRSSGYSIRLYLQPATPMGFS